MLTNDGEWFSMALNDGESMLNDGEWFFMTIGSTMVSAGQWLLVVVTKICDDDSG